MSEWRTIKDYPDYEISDEGVIVSYKYKKPRIMKTRKDKEGYLRVGISKNNTTKTATVHRLVAETFIPNPDNLPIVRHLNDIPNDNKVSNLAWGTPKDNTADLIKNGNHCVKGPKRRRETIFEKDDKYYEFNSLSEGCKKLNLNLGHASEVAKGHRKTTGGYSVRFKD